MKLIILCGTPGSGKSTLCKQYPDYYRINQDELGDRYKCLEEFRKAAKENKNIIIDRCNINRSQRAVWLNEAKHYSEFEEIKCIVINIDPETCIFRISQRKDHPNLNTETSLAKTKEIVYNFFKSYETPTLNEGFDVIQVLE